MVETGEGLVVSRYGAEVQIQLADHQVVRAVARRKLQHIVCGDRVQWQRDARKDYVVTRIQTRKNTLTRRYFRETKKTLAANIDQIIIITAIRPEIDWSIVDGLLVAAELMEAKCLILHHKSDLPGSQQLQTPLTDYAEVGYPILATASKDPASIRELMNHCQNKISILVGQSGMGKSTLTNLMIPDADAKIQAISGTSGLGQHTTSVTRLYRMQDNAALIDSPGIRDFSPPRLKAIDYQLGFREFGQYRQHCRFHNCLHTKEPGCALRVGVKNGEVSERRYNSYIKLLQQAEN